MPDDDGSNGAGSRGGNGPVGGRGPGGRGPGGAHYDAAHIRGFFDTYGEREWTRLEADAPARVNFHRHRRFLERHVRAGDRVLEVGAGPGRFTIELARLGARVTVADLSPVQLALNRRAFPDGAFDATDAFGGPLGYVLDGRDRAMAELLRVTRPADP